MKPNFAHIKVIGFDADDTLWVNETYFREAEQQFAAMLAQFETPNKIDQELFKLEIKNLPLYGYGIKGFVLSMVEIALKLSNYTVSNNIIEEIINIGKNMLDKPVELLDGVKEVLEVLEHKYKLILVTKGDLLDQERKLEKSNLSHYFHHIEVLSDKQTANYSALLNHLDVAPSEFLMIGNSLKSDVLPIVELKANAIHVPFHTTWLHEQVSEIETNGKSYLTLNSLREIVPLLN